MVLAHASAWVRLVVPEWEESWELHLQLVGREGAGGWTWMEVDLTGRPLRASPPVGLSDPGTPGLPARALAGLGHWLERHRVRVFRSPATGLVSEAGEDAEVFRRRVLAAARPAVLAARESGAQALGEAAQLLAAISSAIESRALPLPVARMRVQAGPLVVPSLDCLRPPGRAPDPMVRGEVRGG